MNMGIMGSPAPGLSVFARMGNAVASAASAAWTYVSAGAARLFSCFFSASREVAPLEGRAASVEQVPDNFPGAGGSPAAPLSDSQGPVRFHAAPAPGAPWPAKPPTQAHDSESEADGNLDPQRAPALDSKHVPTSVSLASAPRVNDLMAKNPWVPASRAEALEYAKVWIDSKQPEDLNHAKLLRSNAAGEVAVSRYIGAQASQFLEAMVEEMLDRVATSMGPRTMSAGGKSPFLDRMDLEEAAARAFTDVLRDKGRELPASEKGLLRDLVDAVSKKDIKSFKGLSVEQRVISNVLILKSLGKVFTENLSQLPKPGPRYDACHALMRASIALCDSGEFRTTATTPSDPLEALAFLARSTTLNDSIRAMKGEALEVTSRLLDL
jgi:hypothetical protein